MKQSLRPTGLRIIAAIAAKDITDAIKNRTVLSIILGTTVLMLSSLAIPWLTKLRSVPTAIVYDPGRTTLIRALTTREEFQLGFVNSQKAMAEAVASAPDVRLGLVIPEGFGQVSGDQETVTLTGYVAHWAKPQDVEEVVAFFETQLTEASWRDVQIDVTGRTVYPPPDTFGLHTMTITTISTAMLMMGLAIVPNLLLEEKGSHTLEALLVTPARYGQIVAGKAVAGMLYALCASGIAYLFNAKWFAHPWLALGIILLGAVFAVAAGLLTGILVENPESINAWMGIGLGILLIPVFIVNLVDKETSAALYTVLTWIPTTAISRLMLVSTGPQVTSQALLPDVARLAGSAALLIGIILWRIRKTDR